MLSEKTIAIVKSTAPVLKEHGEVLTRHFYKRMFAHNPEVESFFNPTHQHTGEQQKALAASICAYAENIDNLAILRESVELIAQKHASLLIQPDQYPIVGSNLLASIREVLGENATDEIITAWEEAYNFLATILINREKQIYQEQSSCKNGWEGFKSFQMLKKEKESDIITSFYLAPVAGDKLPSFKPGQYITVRMKRPDGVTTMRNYSLSNQPGQDYFRISVKREIGAKADTPKGYVSNQLHENFEVGDTIEIAPPCGEFFLDLQTKSQAPLVLLAGGIGITPIMSILLTALEHMKHRSIILIHACVDEKVQAFKRTLDVLASQNDHLKIQHCYSGPAPKGSIRNKSDLSGLISAELINSLVPNKEAEFYSCGPKLFMRDVSLHLHTLGIPEEHIHFEFFGPKQDLTSVSAGHN